MRFIPTDFQDLFVIEPTVHKDERGFFLETFREEIFAAQGIAFKAVQANQAFSAASGVLRGLHFQVPPKTQAKLVWVSKGRALDVVVDLRKNSPTFGRHYSLLLSADNFRRLFVPKGFAHGYITLGSNVEFNYMVDEYYSPAHEGGLLWNDPALGINWGFEENAAPQTPIVAARDAAWPCLKDLDNPF